RLGGRLAARELLGRARRLVGLLRRRLLAALEVALARAEVPRSPLELALPRLEVGVDVGARLLRELLGVEDGLPLERLRLGLGRLEQALLLGLALGQRGRAERTP